ncbi:MAG: hypothetical protein JNL53_12955 [Cyclobacteriaceae bacterium]|nr:hypothetical protein [Cyclobacteriaceae bacterium]
MWWNKKKESLEEKIVRIVKDSVSKTGTTITEVAERLKKEAGLSDKAALGIAEIALSKISTKKEEVLKSELASVLELPFSKSHRDLIEKAITNLSNNKTDSKELSDSIFNIRLLESEDWLLKGEKLIIQNKLNEALDCFDISLKFNQHNTSCLIERGKVLQDLDFHKDAIKDFSKVIDERPNDFSIIYLRGCSYMKIWELKNAENDFNKAIQLSVNANERQTRAAKENGFDSVASMYRRMLNMLTIFKDDDTEFIEQMKMINNKERSV